MGGGAGNAMSRTLPMHLEEPLHCTRRRRSSPQAGAAAHARTEAAPPTARSAEASGSAAATSSPPDSVSCTTCVGGLGWRMGDAEGVCACSSRSKHGRAPPGEAPRCKPPGRPPRPAAPACLMQGAPATRRGAPPHLPHHLAPRVHRAQHRLLHRLRVVGAGRQGGRGGVGGWVGVGWGGWVGVGEHRQNSCESAASTGLAPAAIVQDPRRPTRELRQAEQRGAQPGALCRDWKARPQPRLCRG